MAESRSKGWVITLNNYTEDEWEAYQQLGGHPHVSYVIGAKEQGEGGTPHIQGYVEFKNRKKLSTVKRITPLQRAHLEPRRGTPQEAADYCRKEDGETYEYGSLPIAIQRGQRTDLEHVFQAAKDGMSTRDLWKHFPNQMVRYAHNPVFKFLLTQ